MTSIEWLEYKTQNTKWIDLTLSERKEIIQQAKEMHKQEIMDFARHCLNKAKDTDILTAFINTQQYYQETLKND